MIGRHWGLARRAFANTPGAPPRQNLALVEAFGGRPRDLHRNERSPVLVVDEAQLASADAMRSLHQIDAELVRDVADDQE
jgi:hypothetical protein